MSFRSATRVATRLAAQRSLPRAQIGARRAASTSKPKGGDTTWMIGSAAVFGSLGAFLLLPGSKTHEAAHGSNHDRSEQSGKDTPTAKPGQDPVQHGGANTQSFTADDPKSIHKEADKYPGTIPSKRHEAKTTGYPGEQIDDSGSDLGSNRFSSDKPSGGQSGSETPDNVDESGGPSASDIKDSVKQAAKSNVPEVAWNEDSKKSDGSSSGSGTETPSNVDDSDAPSPQEIKDSVRQAAKTNVPEVAWNEEAKK